MYCDARTPQWIRNSNDVYGVCEIM
jgi:hypothetical protein